MISKTLVAIRAVLDLDTTISEEHREGILQFAMNDGYTTANILKKHDENEVISIATAAKMLGKAIPTIHRYLKNGTLRSITPPGRKRAIGVSLQSIHELERCATND